MWFTSNKEGEQSFWMRDESFEYVLNEKAKERVQIGTYMDSNRHKPAAYRNLFQHNGGNSL